MADQTEQDVTFCEQCRDETPVKRTVPWQPDVCTVCGADVSADE